MNNEIEIEKEIQKKGLNAPRLSPGLIDAKIKDEYYQVVPGTTTTLCSLTLQNGFQVNGESASASTENFNEELGRKIARDKAREKIWQLEGYLLKEKLYQDSNSTYQIRLKDEYLELKEKSKKLEIFLEKQEYKELKESEQTLLLDQYNHMMEYLNILTTRLKNTAFEVSVNLPETPDWNGTVFSEELEKVITKGLSVIKTSDGCMFVIISKDQVQSIQ